MKRQIKTSRKKIAEYWILNNDIDEVELNFDWADAHTHCWNCGKDKSNTPYSLERCHIIPYSLNGQDIPSNFVLLCKECHAQAPNTSNKNDMWDWIRSNFIPTSLYGTYKIRKALEMFEKKEGYSFFEKVINIEDINKVLEIEMGKVGTHGRTINVSTYYYIFKNIINNYT